jgi:hypothetical protein
MDQPVTAPKSPSGLSDGRHGRTVGTPLLSRTIAWRKAPRDESGAPPQARHWHSPEPVPECSFRVVLLFAGPSPLFRTDLARRLAFDRAARIVSLGICWFAGLEAASAGDRYRVRFPATVRFARLRKHQRDRLGSSRTRACARASQGIRVNRPEISTCSNSCSDGAVSERARMSAFASFECEANDRNGSTPVLRQFPASDRLPGRLIIHGWSSDAILSAYAIALHVRPAGVTGGDRPRSGRSCGRSHQ